MEDRAVVRALLTVAAGLALNAAVSWSSPHPIEQPNQQTNRQPHHEAEGPEPWWIVATFWEAIFTGLIAIYAIRQYRESQRSAERQLRAYIGVTNARVTIEAVPDIANRKTYRLRGVLTVRNSGQTPAYGLCGAGAIRCGTEFNKAWLRELTQHEQSGYIIPEGVFEFRTERDLSELSAEGPDDQPGQWLIFWFGRLEYRDAFGTDRWVNFRYKLSGDIFRTFGGKPTTHPCENGNDAN